jgi:hypothetical protein
VNSIVTTAEERAMVLGGNLAKRLRLSGAA